jgi:hypothetical protein
LPLPVIFIRNSQSNYVIILAMEASEIGHMDKAESLQNYFAIASNTLLLRFIPAIYLVKLAERALMSPMPHVLAALNF